MAVTETPPETVAAASADASPAAPAAVTGLAAVLGTGDHKVIGRIYIVASLVLGGVVIGLAQAFGVEAISTDGLDVFAASNAYQAFTLMRVGSIFLLALPLVIGVAMVVVPLQVGARTVAFPRAAAASLWGWLLGSALLIASYLMDGGPLGDSTEGVRLWIASMGLLVVSVLVAAVCLATTVFALRTPGMSMDRVPMFAWSVAVAAVLWLLTLPALLGQLVIMYVDNRHSGSIYIGSAASLYGAVNWLFRNPQIYVVAIPVLGFALDVLATSSKARSKGRGIAQPAIGAFGTLAFGAFLLAPTTAGLESLTVVIMSVMAVAPVLAVAAVAGDAFRKQGFSLNAGVLYASVALLVLLLTTVAGAIGSVPGLLEAPGDATIVANIFFLGVSHGAVLAAVIGGLGGVWWWATKVGRQPADAKLGMLAPLVLLVGAVLIVVPDLVSGIAGEGQELLADYTGGIEALNVVVALGVGILALGVLLALVSFAPLLKQPADEVPADPWDGQTLEWLAPSPPPVENFVGELAVVTSAEPLIDLREEK